MAKETYVYGKRGLLVWQKRPTCMATEASVSFDTSVSECVLLLERVLLLECVLLLEWGVCFF